MVGVERDVRDLVDAVERLKARGYNPRIIVDNDDLHRLSKKLNKPVQAHQHEDCNWYAGFWIGRCFFESEGGV